MAHLRVKPNAHKLHNVRMPEICKQLAFLLKSTNEITDAILIENRVNLLSSTNKALIFDLQVELVAQIIAIYFHSG